MKELLDNPVWSALITGNKHLAHGNDLAKRFQTGVANFVGVAQHTPEHYSALKELVLPGETVATFSADSNLDAQPLTVVDRVGGYQLIYEGPTPPEQEEITISELTDKDVPAMLELTKFNPPGPFLHGTIRLGGYQGVFSGTQLVAMAGNRFHCGPYVEISAVCTHPHHTGKGYARAIINAHIRQLRAAGKLPFLHLRSNNTRALNIYQDMGFVVRTEMIVHILANK